MCIMFACVFTYVYPTYTYVRFMFMLTVCVLACRKSNLLCRVSISEPHLPLCYLQETDINPSAKGFSVGPAPLWPPA